MTEGQVRCSNVWWTRVDAGFRNKQGDIIPVQHFVGAVNARQVQAEHEVDPQVGELFYRIGWATKERRWALVLATVDNTVHWLGINDGEPSTLSNEGLETFRENWLRYPDPPDWIRFLVPVGNSYQFALVQFNAQVERVSDLSTQNAELQQRIQAAPRFPENFVSGFHTLLDRFDDDDDRERVNAYLDDFGVGRTEEPEIDVTITGRSYIQPSYDEAARSIGGGVTVSEMEDSTLVYWRKTVTLTREGVGCQCSTIENSDLDDYLPGDYDDWDFVTECHCQG